LENLWYSGGKLEISGASASFVELAWISKEQRQSSKLLELESFDACKNAAVPMIVMLGHLELDMEVLDIGMETVGSNDCREMCGPCCKASYLLSILVVLIR